LIYALVTGSPDQQALEFAVAASALKDSGQRLVVMAENEAAVSALPMPPAVLERG
jgi:hypothetical protein